MELRAASYDSADAQLLTAEVQQEYVRRYGGEGDTAPVDTSEFDGEGGRFFMVYVDDVPAAMGGWRRHEPLAEWRDAEIKRMYVRPAFQRRGLARLLLSELERTAAEAGITRLILETGLEQPEAIAMYRSAGYDDIPAFGYYADDELSVHLGKVLDDTGS
ncbi:acetyltransferase [Aeromicrobium sp. Root236]|nr:acetyltransferase [Aeromicrobium sp. Root236]